MSLNTLSILTLLAEYGSPAHIVQHVEEAEQLLCKTGGSGLKVDKLEALLESSANTFGVPYSTGECLYIQQLAQDLLRTRKASQAVEQRIEKALEYFDRLSTGDMLSASRSPAFAAKSPVLSCSPYLVT